MCICRINNLRQHTTHSTDMLWSIITFAGRPILRCRVSSAFQCILPDHTNVSLFSPVSSPTVPNIPELLTAIDPITSKENRMIHVNILTIVASSEYSTIIHHPGFGSNRNRERSIIYQGSLYSIWVVIR